MIYVEAIAGFQHHWPNVTIEEKAQLSKGTTSPHRMLLPRLC